MENYHLYDPIGQGTGSTTFKARRKKTLQYVAVKRVDMRHLDSVQNEVFTLHLLDHSHVVKFIQWYKSSRHIWVILEYCTGGDLATIIQQDKQLPEDAIQIFGRDLSDGLQYLHSRGFLHCNLKPSNALLDEYGWVKLSDLRMAQPIPQSVEEMKRGGILQGSPFYMAPELFRVTGFFTMASDIWALGVIMFELATGHPPYQSDNLDELMKQILTDPLDLTQYGFSTSFEDLLSQCLQKNPYRRISWEGLRAHRFWAKGLKTYALPVEPAFEALRGEFQDLDRTPTLVNEAPGLAPPSGGSVSVTSSVNLQQLRDNAKHHLLEHENQTAVQTVAARQNAPPEQVPDEFFQNDEDAEGDDDRSRLSHEISESASIRLPDANVELNFGARRPPAHEDNKTDESKEVADAEEPEAQGSDTPTALVPGRPRLDPIPVLPRPAATPSSRRMSSQDRKPRKPSKLPQLRPETAPFNDPIPAEPKALKPLQLHATTPSAADTHRGKGVLDRIRPATSTHSHRRDSIGMSTLAPVVGRWIFFEETKLEVKSIVDNYVIEKKRDRAPLNEKHFTFKLLTVKQLVELTEEEVTAFIGSIYRQINGDSVSKVSHRMHAVTYFQSLCRHDFVADMFVNRPIMSGFLQMLKENSPNSTFKSYILELIGILLRYATQIVDGECPVHQLLQDLSEAIRDTNTKVRRRAVAALGELLFFIATSHGTRVIPQSTVTLFKRCLNEREDLVVQHYVVKTIENICFKGHKCAAAFATKDTLLSIASIYSRTNLEPLRLTCAGALFHLMRVNAALVPVFASKNGVGLIFNGLRETSTRIICYFINILNTAIFHKPPLPRLREDVREHDGIAKRLVALLGGNSNNVKAKALVTMCLMGTFDLQWIEHCCTHYKCIAVIDRIGKISHKHSALSHCFNLFRSHVQVWIAPTMFTVAAGLEKMLGRNHPPPALMKQFMTSISHLNVVSALIQSPHLRSYVVDHQFITDLSKILSMLPELTFAESDQIQQLVFGTVEVISAIPASASQEQLAIVRHLLPAMLSLATDSGMENHRFRAFKCFSDLLIQMLRNPSSYHPAGASKPEEPAEENTADLTRRLTESLDEFLHRHAIRRMYEFLKEAELLSPYAMKLLANIVEVNAAFVGGLHRAGLSTVILHLFDGHRKNTIHSVKVVKAIVECSEVPLSFYEEQGFWIKFGRVLPHALEDRNDQFYEPLLDIMLQLLRTISTQVANTSNPSSLLRDHENVLDSMETLFQLLKASLTDQTLTVPMKCCSCLLLIAKLYPEQHELLCADQQLHILASTLECAHNTLMEGDARDAQRTGSPTLPVEPDEVSVNRAVDLQMTLLQLLHLVISADEYYVKILAQEQHAALVHAIGTLARSTAPNRLLKTPAQFHDVAALAQSLHRLLSS